MVSEAADHQPDRENPSPQMGSKAAALPSLRQRFLFLHRVRLLLQDFSEELQPQGFQKLSLRPCGGQQQSEPDSPRPLCDASSNV